MLKLKIVIVRCHDEQDEIKVIIIIIIIIINLISKIKKISVHMYSSITDHVIIWLKTSKN